MKRVLICFTALCSNLIFSEASNIVCGTKIEKDESFSDVDTGKPNPKTERIVKSLIQCCLLCQTVKCGSFSYLPDTGTCQTSGMRLCTSERVNQQPLRSDYFNIDLYKYDTALCSNLIFSEASNIVCGTKIEKDESFSDVDTGKPNPKTERIVKSLIQCCLLCQTVKCGSFSYLPDTGTCQTSGMRVCTSERVNQQPLRSDYFNIDLYKYDTGCNKPKSCKDILSLCGIRESGIYTIFPDSIDRGLDVQCDMESDGGGWMVFQRRMGGTEDFYRTWKDYKEGFGDLCGEFWLGNEIIHNITYESQQEMRIDMEDFNGNTRYATYGTFSIGDETSNFVLAVSGFQGNTDDSMSLHNGRPFSTKDLDNDVSAGNCAQTYRGAWWYAACHFSNLNGLYFCANTTIYAKGIVWYHWTTYFYSLKTVTMKLRPRH